MENVSYCNYSLIEYFLMENVSNCNYSLIEYCFLLFCHHVLILDFLSHLS